jgi:hypothetical protein
MRETLRNACDRRHNGDSQLTSAVYQTLKGLYLAFIAENNRARLEGWFVISLCTL